MPALLGTNLNVPDLSVFNADALVRISCADLAGLRRGEEIPLKVSTADDQVIVYRSGARSCFERDPVAAVMTFAANAWVANFDHKRGVARLDVSYALKERLRFVAARAAESAPPVSLARFVSGAAPGLFDGRQRLHPNFVGAVGASGSFIGRASTCHCGEVGCGAEYAWVEGDVCLLYVLVSGTRVRQVRLLPLRIVR